ncbi:MAG: flagellar protein FlgN, partial [Bradyrhizobium sp.]|nr:flagellar protein FlgN [Bradyrhizobium sp.]
MRQKVEVPQTAASEDEVRALIALIDELIAVVAEENVELAKGLPA